MSSSFDEGHHQQQPVSPFAAAGGKRLKENRNNSEADPTIKADLCSSSSSSSLISTTHTMTTATAAGGGSSSNPPAVSHLPQEVMLFKVFEFLSPEELCRAMASCRSWRALGGRTHFWEMEVMKQWPGVLEKGRGRGDDYQYYNFFVRQRLALSRAVEGEGWWSRYTLMLRLIDRESGTVLFSKSQELGVDFEADVTGHANYSMENDLEYSGYLITPPTNTSTMTFVINDNIPLRDWFLCPRKLHAECMLLDRHTGSMACVYATQERDIRDGRMILEEGPFDDDDEQEEEEGGEQQPMQMMMALVEQEGGEGGGPDITATNAACHRIEVVEVFKRNPSKYHHQQQQHQHQQQQPHQSRVGPYHHPHQQPQQQQGTWARLHYSFTVMHRREQEGGGVLAQVQHCGLLLEGLQRKPRPYSYDDGCEWREVRQWAQSLDWC